MTGPCVKAILAGVCFGLWPLFLNKSGLNGNVSSACFSLVILVGVLPFAIYSNGLTVPTANWVMVVSAGSFGALGLLFFNSMLAEASLQNIGTLIVLMTLVQVVIPSLYQVIMSGQFSVGKITGYILAAMAAYLLLR